MEAIRPHAESLGLPLLIETLPARRFDVEANVLDSTKLHVDAGWKIRIPFREGIQRTWDWFSTNKDQWIKLRDAKR